MPGGIDILERLNAPPFIVGLDLAVTPRAVERSLANRQRPISRRLPRSDAILAICGGAVPLLFPRPWFDAWAEPWLLH